MKISRDWLQTFFDAPLPNAATLAEALTFHAFEIDGLEKHQDDDVLDVKVTPNRGHDCLSHFGIARELSAILSLPLSAAAMSRFHLDIGALKIGGAEDIEVRIETPTASRYLATRMTGVKVGPSPAWLVKRLEALGQRSINNIVDATNCAMFSYGQPLHAFDAETLKKGNGYAVGVRTAHAGEQLVALDGKTYELNETMMVIAGGEADIVLGIAGVKGGKDSGVSDSTTSLIIESANFDGVSVRKTSRALDLRTDASARFEQQLSPSMAPLGMLACVELIREIAGGDVVGSVDVFPHELTSRTLEISTVRINKLLGTTLSDADVASVFTRLGLEHTRSGDVFSVAVPHERIDLTIPEDLVEEVGRIVGYDAAPATELPPLSVAPAVNANFAAIDALREELVSQGYSEVYTSVFSEKGDRAVLNKVGGDRPFLRTSLLAGLTVAQKKNAELKELLELSTVKLFEIGTVWNAADESIMVGIADKSVTEKPLSAYPVPEKYGDFATTATEKYQPFSRFPYIVRDIALWVPTSTDPQSVLALIREHAGDLLVRAYQFDSFTKGERTSYAFRLVFQSFDRTLIDDDANTRMASVTAAVTGMGYEVR